MGGGGTCGCGWEGDASLNGAIGLPRLSGLSTLSAGLRPQHRPYRHPPFQCRLPTFPPLPPPGATLHIRLRGSSEGARRSGFHARVASATTAACASAAGSRTRSTSHVASESRSHPAQRSLPEPTAPQSSWRRCLKRRAMYASTRIALQTLLSASSANTRRHSCNVPEAPMHALNATTSGSARHADGPTSMIWSRCRAEAIRFR